MSKAFVSLLDEDPGYGGAPIVADAEDKPLFMDSKLSEFKLKEIKQYDDIVWMNYKKAGK